MVVAGGGCVDRVSMNHIRQTLSSKAQAHLASALVKGMGRGLSLSHKAPLFAQEKLWLGLMNKMLAEPLKDGDLECLQDSWLQVTVSDLNVSWYFTLMVGKLAMKVKQPADFMQCKHCIISGELMDLIRLLNRQQDPDTLFFQRRLSLTGDTELGLEIRIVLDAIDSDDLPLKAKLLMQWSAHLTAMPGSPYQ